MSDGMADVKTLREAATIYEDATQLTDGPTARLLRGVADHLEEMVDRKVAIEKAARVQCDGFYGPGYFDRLSSGNQIRERYINDCTHLADAGLLKLKATTE